MDFEGALRARLTGDAAVNALVGSRVYWENRPQGSPYPAVVLDYVVDARDQNMGGFQTLQRKLIQISVFTVDTPTTSGFAQKKALKEAVIAAIAPSATVNGIKFRPIVAPDPVPINERTETQFIYGDAIRPTIFFSPA
jgi:hypothetical protein